MWLADAACHPDPNVVFTRLGENDGVLLHLNTKRYYSLNGTGSRLWELSDSTELRGGDYPRWSIAS
jgi:hypothetical protein